MHRRPPVDTAAVERSIGAIRHTVNQLLGNSFQTAPLSTAAQQVVTAVQPLIRLGSLDSTAPSRLEACSKALTAYENAVLRFEQQQPGSRMAVEATRALSALEDFVDRSMSTIYPFEKHLTEAAVLARRHPRLARLTGLVAIEALNTRGFAEALELSTGRRASALLSDANTWEQLIKNTAGALETVEGPFQEGNAFLAVDHLCEHAGTLHGITTEQVKDIVGGATGLEYAELVEYDEISTANVNRHTRRATVEQTLLRLAAFDRQRPGSVLRRVTLAGTGGFNQQSDADRLRHDLAAERMFPVVQSGTYEVTDQQVELTSIAITIFPVAADGPTARGTRAFSDPGSRVVKAPGVANFWMFVSDLNDLEAQLGQVAKTVTAQTGLPLRIVELMAHGQSADIDFGKTKLEAKPSRYSNAKDGRWFGETVRRATAKVPQNTPLRLLIGSCLQTEDTLQEMAQGLQGKVMGVPDLFLWSTYEENGVLVTQCSPNIKGPIELKQTLSFEHVREIAAVVDPALDSAPAFNPFAIHRTAAASHGIE